MLYQRLIATGATAYIDMMLETGKRILNQHRKHASSSASARDSVHTWACSANITLVAVVGVEEKNQALSRDSRTAIPVPSTSPRTNDTNLDARRAVMDVCDLWRMSLLGVYAYDWVIEYVRCSLICCSFAVRDPPILFPAHAGITNIVPTAGPMRVQVFVSALAARSLAFRSVGGMPGPVLWRPVVIVMIISNG